MPNATVAPSSSHVSQSSSAEQPCGPNRPRAKPLPRKPSPPPPPPAPTRPNIVTQLEAVMEEYLAADGAGGRPDAEALRAVLQSWKEAAAPPTHVACVFGKQYDRNASFSASSLASGDALLLKELRPLTDELGFSLYLGHVDGVLSIGSSVPGYDPYDSDYADEDEFPEEDFVDEDDDSAEELTELKQIVDLTGLPVSVGALVVEADGKLSLDSADWSAYICGPVIDRYGEPDAIEFERNEIDSANRVKRWSRTILLIWPSDGAIQKSVGAGNVYSYAAHFLVPAKLTSAPTTREMTIVDALIARIDAFKHRVEPPVSEDTFMFGEDARKETKAIPKAMVLLGECATKWGIADVFLRALDACEAQKDVSFVGKNGIADACRAFGWHTMRAFCDKAMAEDDSLKRKSVLLQQLMKLATETADPEMKVWCKEQRKKRTLPDDGAVSGKPAKKVKRTRRLTGVYSSRRCRDLLQGSTRELRAAPAVVDFLVLTLPSTQFFER
ncbi:hypothetical protein MKEN_00199800 [Mycena kentingensis (nom. inval.)]|nr:hypothetical protein MKEN_00199800 [Mycena kentingensis (nom. inval.)]